jgi:exonuclease III
MQLFGLFIVYLHFMSIMSLRLCHFNIQKLYSGDIMQHRNKICSVIKKINPHILSLCEVTNLDELNEIGTKTNPNYYPYFVQSKDTKMCQNTGLLTTINPTIAPYSFTNNVAKHFATTLVIGKIKLALVSAHLTAFPLNPKKIKIRERQAYALKTKIDELIDLGNEVILTGDLNDFDGDILDNNGNDPMSNVLNILKGNNLISTSEKLPRCKRYTYNHLGNKEMIDHVLVTPKLYKMIDSVNVFHQEKKSIHDSDHDPLIVDFNL